jgi:hypothetical protein
MTIKSKEKLTKVKTKVDKAPKKVGRPTLYTPELADRICELVAIHDMGLTRLTATFPDLPDKSNINKWRLRHEDFRVKYAQAKCHQLEFMTEDILEIADDASNDWMEQYDKNQGCISWRVNGEHIQRSRVRIDTRKWLASKLAPKMYGDSLAQENNNPLHEDVIKRKHELDEKNKKEF